MTNRDRLKVLFITPWYPEKYSPVAGVFVREHAKAVRLQNDVLVLHYAGTDSHLRTFWRMEQETNDSITEGVPTYRVYCRNFPIRGFQYLISLWSIIQACRKVTLMGFSPDIIHAHIHSVGLSAILVGKLFGVPVVITEQSTAFPRKLLSRSNVLTARLAFGLADRVLPVSSQLQQAISDYGIKGRFNIVPNIADTTIFYPSTDKHRGSYRKRILCVALLDMSHKKGIPYLFQSLARLQQKRNDWHLDIVGDGDARKEYEQLAIDLRLSDKITFHGIRSKWEIAQFMRDADFFVLPSLFETFGTVVVEALASGTPVLVTRCGGPEDFVSESVGLVVSPGDVDALTRGLEYILEHHESYSSDSLAEYARNRFSHEAVGQKLNEVYLAVIEG